MNKTPERLQQRREYIAERISNAKHHGKEVRKLCEELYLDENTIYRDLKIITQSKHQY